jgi:hypothetical protein
LVYLGLPWFTLVYLGLPWFTLVYTTIVKTMLSINAEEHLIGQKLFESVSKKKFKDSIFSPLN